MTASQLFTGRADSLLDCEYSFLVLLTQSEPRISYFLPSVYGRVFTTRLLDFSEPLYTVYVDIRVSLETDSLKKGCF